MMLTYNSLFSAFNTLCMHMIYIWASHSDKTPLLCAAEAGHDEIVTYLLQFRKVQGALEEQLEKLISASVSLHAHNLTYSWYTQYVGMAETCNISKALKLIKAPSLYL